jgi:hypothetical protein
MASEIIVQTLKGPASGSNANKVIIPSGQTLDASAGFTPPTGHVIKTSAWNPTVSTTTSAELVDVATTSLSFTQNSLINVNGQMKYRNNNTSDWTLIYIGMYVDGIGQVYRSSYEGVRGAEYIGKGVFNFNFIWSVSGAATVRLQGGAYNSKSSSFGNSDQASQSTQNEFLTFMEIAQ